MKPKDISKFDISGKKQRKLYQDLNHFINSRLCREGCILVLSGLWQTGKKTLMEQAAAENLHKEKCAFYNVEITDSMSDVYHLLEEEKKKGTTLLFLDEITNAKNFIQNSSILPDVYAKAGMKIIVTGTESLGFMYAGEGELFDRTVDLRTTHIPFAEHCRVLGVNDMDDYIRYGGVMNQGNKEDRIVHDYESAQKYLLRSVSDNIVNNFKKGLDDSFLNEISETEIRTIIEKLVELCSGSFREDILREDLKNAAICPADRLSEIELADDLIEYPNLERKKVMEDFLKMINVHERTEHEIKPCMIHELAEYLEKIDVFSATQKETYDYTEENGWKIRCNEHKRVKWYPDYYDYHIIQPAVKFYHLQKAKERMMQQEYFQKLPDKVKAAIQDKLEEKIFADMMKRIVLFDTRKALPEDRYEVTQLNFYINGRKKGRYDMVIYDKNELKYWEFEIRHTQDLYPKQEEDLSDKLIREYLNWKHGKNRSACILYCGKTFRNDAGTYCLNITDFALAAEAYHDMDRIFEELSSIK